MLKKYVLLFCAAASCAFSNDLEKRENWAPCGPPKLEDAPTAIFQAPELLSQYMSFGAVMNSTFTRKLEGTMTYKVGVFTRAAKDTSMLVAALGEGESDYFIYMPTDLVYDIKKDDGGGTIVFDRSALGEKEFLSSAYFRIDAMIFEKPLVAEKGKALDFTMLNQADAKKIDKVLKEKLSAYFTKIGIASSSIQYTYSNSFKIGETGFYLLRCKVKSNKPDTPSVQQDFVAYSNEKGSFVIRFSCADSKDNMWSKHIQEMIKSIKLQ